MEQSRDDLTDGEVADVAAPGLGVLFCGINPGLLSAALGQHFARPGNRFWKVLHAAGFTSSVLAPSEQDQLIDLGVGITNLVERPSASAAELSACELRAGAARLEERVARLAPRYLAVLGVLAYRTAFARPKAVVGEQPERIADSGLWVLPNPSGLQARYQMAEMASLYEALRLAAGLPSEQLGP